MIGYDPYSKKHSGVNWRHVSAGAVSGCMTRFMCQPFDVIKIRFQLQLEPINRKSLKSKYRSIPQSVRTIVAEEGMSALWKAHLCAQMLSCVYGMIQFSSFELYTQLVNSSGLSDNRQNEFALRHQMLVHFLCGSMSGFSASLVAHPMDVIRTRIIAQSEPKTYRSTIHAYKTIVHLEGYRGLFRGLVPTLMQIAPFTGIQFTVYNVSVNFWDKFIEHKNYKESQSNKMKGLYYFEKTLCCGAVSGLAAKLMVYPLDLIKKRLQVEGFQKSRKGFGAVSSYRGTVDCVLKIIRQENFFAFYKGLTPSLMKSAIVTALNFSIYENVFKFLNKKYK